MDFFVFGKAVGLELREDFGFVQEDFKAAVGERAQFERSHALLELLQNLLRQPDGMRLVFSAGAVLDANVHGISCFWDKNFSVASVAIFGYRESRGSVIKGGCDSPVTPPECSSMLTTTSPSNRTKTVRSGGVP